MVEKIYGEYYIKTSKMLNWLEDKCSTKQAISDSYRNACTRMLMGERDENSAEYEVYKGRCFVTNAIAQVYVDIYDMISREALKCINTECD